MKGLPLIQGKVIAKWSEYKIFFRTPQPISTSFNKSSLGEGIHFFSNEGEIIAKKKNSSATFKSFFSRTTGPISTKFVTDYSLIKGCHICTSEEEFCILEKEKRIYNVFLFIIVIV